VQFGLTIGATLMGAALCCAPAGHADRSAEFGEQFYQTICNYVGQEPTAHGIWAANSVLLSQQSVPYQLDYKQMQNAIGYAIQNHCPQYNSIYSAYRAQWP
jgi:hypothetical protein